MLKGSRGAGINRSSSYYARINLFIDPYIKKYTSRRRPRAAPAKKTSPDSVILMWTREDERAGAGEGCAKETREGEMQERRVQVRDSK